MEATSPSLPAHGATAVPRKSGIKRCLKKLFGKAPEANKILDSNGREVLSYEECLERQVRNLQRKIEGSEWLYPRQIQEGIKSVERDELELLRGREQIFKERYQKELEPLEAELRELRYKALNLEQRDNIIRRRDQEIRDLIAGRDQIRDFLEQEKNSNIQAHQSVMAYEDGIERAWAVVHDREGATMSEMDWKADAEDIQDRYRGSVHFTYCSHIVNKGGCGSSTATVGEIKQVKRAYEKDRPRVATVGEMLKELNNQSKGAGLW
jgi:hypothetical protein